MQNTSSFGSRRLDMSGVSDMRGQGLDGFALLKAMRAQMATEEPLAHIPPRVEIVTVIRSPYSTLPAVELEEEEEEPAAAVVG